MKRSAIVISGTLCAGLLAVLPAGSAFAAGSAAPAAPVVTTSVSGNTATLTITGEAGARATVVDSNERTIASTKLTDGSARVLVPVSQGIATKLNVTQRVGAGAVSPETSTVVGDGDTAIAPIRLIPVSAHDSDRGTTATFFVEGVPRATVAVRDSSGSTIATRTIGASGSVQILLRGLSHGATDIAITQSVGSTTSAPVATTVMGELILTAIGDSGSKAYFEVHGAPFGDAVAVDSEGKVIARTALTSEGAFLVVPHTAGKAETVSLHREYAGRRSEGVTRSLSGQPSELRAPSITHNRADDTKDMYGIRILEGSGAANSWTLPGATVSFANDRLDIVKSVSVPTDFSDDNNLVHVPKSAFDDPTYGTHIVVGQSLDDMKSGWFDVRP